MKIVTPLSRVSDYPILAEAGASEFFCGIIPFAWLKKYNTVLPLNRREYLFDNCNITNFTSLKILGRMVEKYGTPVKITLNSQYYISEQYPLLIEFIQRCLELGFETFIIGDPALIVYLRNKKIPCKIHLSGEAGVLNHHTIAFFKELDIERFIFPGKTSLEDIRMSIAQVQTGSQKQYEVFILNDWCVYLGAYCNSVHCDEVPHSCHLPSLVSWNDALPEKFQSISRFMQMRNKLVYKTNFINRKAFYSLGKRRTDHYDFGQKGCGVCQIHKLNEYGVTHLKLVGRGHPLEMTLRDLNYLKECITIAKQLDDPVEYAEEIKKRYFHGKCPEICFYR